MIDQPDTYTQHSLADSREPRYVVSIEYSAGDLEHFSSHAGISGIPVGTHEGVIQDYNASSQSVDPETGSSKIGSLQLSMLDRDGELTDLFQSRLLGGEGLRDKTLRFYKGFAGMAWDDYQLRFTQVVNQATEQRGSYRIACRDLQRELRTKIFELKLTRLAATLSVSETTTMTVTDASEFETVAHGTSYSHGPSGTWGYVKVDDEIIGYTAKTATTFTGLDRGLFGTVPALHEVDPEDPEERRPEVEEYVYLELPLVKLAYAIMTGVIHNQGGATLPDHWHSGIDVALIDVSQFEAIGDDLWVTTNDTRGMIVHFRGLDATDAKLFIEKELYRLAQIFSPILADGRLGLKRLTPALEKAPAVMTLNTSNVVGHGPLLHAMRKVVNKAVINWSFVDGEFRRQTILIDGNSIAAHGQAPTKIYEFRGLASNIATTPALNQLFDAIRDRFTQPPLEISVDILKSVDNLEVGDVVRLQLPNVRDLSAATVNPIDRTFEIQSIHESRNRSTKLQLFGSSGAATPIDPEPAGNALPDGYYDAEGTALETIVDITAGVSGAGAFNLTGNAAMGSGVYYYLGDLTISADTTLTINDNVQLRVRGFLTINGEIDGVGRGLAGVVDSELRPGGTLGGFGSTSGGLGIFDGGSFWRSTPPRTTQGPASVPHYTLEVDGTTLLGTPDDLRGTSGGPGGKVETVQNGGTGGNSGAGFMTVSRGFTLGAAASVDLSGADGNPGTVGVLDGVDCQPGDGAGGAPGAFLVLLDGQQQLPDVLSRFTADGGDTPLTGNPISGFRQEKTQPIDEPITGIRHARVISNGDYAQAAHRIQYVPVPEDPVEDVTVPQPASLTVASSVASDAHILTSPAPPSGVITEYFGSITDDRGDAILLGASTAGRFVNNPDPDQETFYWARNRDIGTKRVSLFQPSTITTTVVGAALNRLAALLTGNGLVNPGAETGTLEGWEIFGAGTWIATDTEPHFGTYHFQSDATTFSRGLESTSRLQVEEGDRLLAQGFVQRTGSAGAEPRQCRARIVFRDAAEAIIVIANGNSTTSGDYVLSRIVFNAPAGAVSAAFQFHSPSHGGDPQVVRADGAYMVIVPRDLDIDALLTTNGPAEAGADVTAPRIVGLVNPNFELGTLGGWRTISGTWSVVSSEPRDGTFHAQGADVGGSGFAQLENLGRAQVTEGDVVRAHGFTQRVGTGSAETFVRVTYYDATDTAFDFDDGNSITGNEYELSKVVSVAPADAVTAAFSFLLSLSDGPTIRADGAFMSIASVSTDQIDLNGATETFFAHASGPIVESNSSDLPFAADILTVAVALEHVTDTVQVVVSGRMEVEQTAGATPFDRVLLAAAATFEPPAQPYDVADSFTVEEEGVFNFSLVGSFSTLSSQTGDYQFGLRLGIFPSSDSIVETTFTDVNVSVGVFKR